MRISDWSSDVCSSDLKIGSAAFTGAFSDHFVHAKTTLRDGTCKKEGRTRVGFAITSVQPNGSHLAICQGGHVEKTPAVLVRGVRMQVSRGRPGGSVIGRKAVLDGPGKTDRKSTRLNSSH